MAFDDDHVGEWKFDRFGKLWPVVGFSLRDDIDRPDRPVFATTIKHLMDVSDDPIPKGTIVRVIATVNRTVYAHHVDLTATEAFSVIAIDGALTDFRPFRDKSRPILYFVLKKAGIRFDD